MSANFQTEGTYAHDNLFAGEFPRVAEKLTVASGAGELARGSVLSLNTDGKAVLVDSTLGDGGDIRREPYAVLAEPVDAESADAEAIVYLAGHFNESELIFGGDDDIDDHRAALRQLGIYTGSNLGA